VGCQVGFGQVSFFFYFFLMFWFFSNFCFLFADLNSLCFAGLNLELNWGKYMMANIF
jgi:hypothetical protein